MSNNLKIRASQAGLMMTRPKTKSKAQQYAEAGESLKNKQTRLAGLSEKAEKTRVKLQDEISKLRFTIEQLEPEKNKIELSETVKSYLIELFWEREHGIRKEITSKYFEKGNEVENDSILLAQKVNGWEQIEKNTESFENDFLTGTPDLVYPEFIPDLKSSWTPHTFPLFDTEIPAKKYWWQLQCYMALTGRRKACLTYALVDTPEILVQDEIYKWARANGAIETPIEIELEIRQAHSYSNLPEKMRVKNFWFDYDEQAVESLYKEIEKGQEFYSMLLEYASNF